MLYKTHANGVRFENREAYLLGAGTAEFEIHAINKRGHMTLIRGMVELFAVPLSFVLFFIFNFF